VKLNEDKIRSDAIDEYRKKQLLEIDLPMTHPLEYMGIWDGYRDGRIIGGFNNSSSSMKIDEKDKRVKFDSYIKHLSIQGNNNNNKAISAVAAADDDDNSSDNDDDRKQSSSEVVKNSVIINRKPFMESVGFIQKAVDSEMSAADEVVSKMRALRTGLGLS